MKPTFIIFLSLFALLTPSRPIPLAVTYRHPHSNYLYDPHPRYTYGYAVHDAVTGDRKSHWERRDGDVVLGEYTLVDADGALRTVKYTADSIGGFRAVVLRSFGAFVAGGGGGGYSVRGRLVG